MTLGLIVAFDDDYCIGKEGRIPWRIPEDMAHFKRLTEGHPVIMGRKTYESLPDSVRPLPDRLNIVLSRSEKVIQGAYVVESLGRAIDLAFERPQEGIDYDKIYVMGGHSVYEDALPLADFMDVTHVKGSHDGDVYFPTVDWNDWRETSRKDLESCSFVSYGRIRK